METTKKELVMLEGIRHIYKCIVNNNGSLKEGYEKFENKCLKLGKKVEIIEKTTYN